MYYPSKTMDEMANNTITLRKFLWIILIKFSHPQSTTSFLKGEVCVDEYPVVRYRCCKDHYIVGNECVVCPRGFYGNNCSEICPPGFYGIKCLSECNCLLTEVCIPASGCLGNVTETQPEGIRTGNSYNYVVHVSVLASSVFLILILLLAILMCCKRRFSGISCKMIDIPLHSSPVPTATRREQRHYEDEYLNESMYAEPRISRMLPEPCVEYGAPVQEYIPVQNPSKKNT